MLRQNSTHTSKSACIFVVIIIINNRIRHFCFCEWWRISNGSKQWFVGNLWVQWNQGNQWFTIATNIKKYTAGTGSTIAMLKRLIWSSKGAGIIVVSKLT